jgi:hypothetical protein
LTFLPSGAVIVDYEGDDEQTNAIVAKIISALSEDRSILSFIRE